VVLMAGNQEVVAKGLTALDWARAGAVLVIGIIAGRVVGSLLARRVRGDDSESMAGAAVARFAGLVVALGALVYALGMVGVRLGPLLGAIGIGGIAVALAAQSILANLIASVLLQARRPFRRGDQITSGEHSGRVEDVNFRVVVLRSYDGERVFLPCSKVLDGPIVNHTSTGRRRSCLEIGVAYGTDLAEAKRVLHQAAAQAEGVHPRPAPEALVADFGESSIEVDLLFWHAPDALTTRRVRSGVALAVSAALDEAGIEVAFPQRVVHLRAERSGSEARMVDARERFADGRGPVS
jgi:small conductance mechanosensitive channel